MRGGYITSFESETFHIPGAVHIKQLHIEMYALRSLCEKSQEGGRICNKDGGGDELKNVKYLRTICYDR